MDHLVLCHSPNRLPFGYVDGGAYLKHAFVVVSTELLGDPPVCMKPRGNLVSLVQV